MFNKKTFSKLLLVSLKNLLIYKSFFSYWKINRPLERKRPKLHIQTDRQTLTIHSNKMIEDDNLSPVQL